MNNVAFNFASSRVLVTGGTSGIGNAIANEFARAKATVTITGTKPSARDYAVDLSAFTYQQCQMSDPDSIDALVGSLDGLDVLINNAGRPFAGGKDEWTPEGYIASVAQNMFGAMRLTTECHPLLKASTAAGGASVISIISMSAFRSAASVPGYASSKAGLNALTWNLARRWAADGIRVNTVAPGIIDTPMTHPAMSMPEVTSTEIDFHTPLGRAGTADDCTGAVLFLCTDTAAFITGTSLVVDGGYLTV